MVELRLTVKSLIDGNCSSVSPCTIPYSHRCLNPSYASPYCSVPHTSHTSPNTLLHQVNSWPSLKRICAPVPSAAGLTQDPAAGSPLQHWYFVACRPLPASSPFFSGVAHPSEKCLVVLLMTMDVPYAPADGYPQN